jgi:raffinose/stachyose/melibiose transport system permease protein
MRFVGLHNYLIVLTDSDQLQVIGNAFLLVAWFTLIPVVIGLAVAAAIRTTWADRSAPLPASSSSCRR